MVTRRARPWKRRRCRSITQSASASLMRNNCLRSRPFSKRDRVGCEARSSPWIGSRPTNSLWTESEPSRAASLVSGYPHAIAMTRCVRSSLNSCLIFFDCRLSSRALARAVVGPNPRRRATGLPRRRNCLVVDQTWPPREAEKFLETEHTVSYYVRSNESLSLG